jgi:hypothetical protein
MSGTELGIIVKEIWTGANVPSGLATMDDKVCVGIGLKGLVSSNNEGSINASVGCMVAGVGERTGVGFEGRTIATEMLRQRQMI